MEQRTTSRRIRTLALGAGLALAAVACGGGASSPSPSTAAPATQPAGSGGASAPPSAPASAAAAGLDEICAQGAEEGALVHWHNHSDEYAQVIAKFNEKHPDIEIEDLVLSPDEAAQRILTEAAAGRAPTPDLAAGGLDVFKPLMDEDIIAIDIDWAGLGVPEDALHPTANLVRIHRIALGLGYNTDKLSAADMPATWEELIDAKWAGKVIVDPRGRPFDSISLADGWGEEKTLDYVQRLKDIVQPQVVEGGTAGLVAVAGGSADITTGGRSAETLEQQAEGAPLEIHYLDVVSTIDNYNAVMADAAHPNAARCYVGWFATEGQDLYNEVEFKTNEPTPAAAPAGAQVVVIESPEDAEAVGSIGEAIGQIWSGG